jgi:4-hydroxybenzoate polyprenyltransferase
MNPVTTASADPLAKAGDQAGVITVASGPKLGAPSDWLRLIRPNQWVKNFFIVFPLLFSGNLLHPGAVLRVGLTFAVFCLLASGVYVWNDVIDRAQDAVHPTKRLRPIAAGRIGARPAMWGGALLLLVALSVAALLDPVIGLLAVAYLGLNVLYSLYLKEAVILDVFALASFFILRLLAGAAVIHVRPSVWLLLCGGLLALYLGFAKRRHELVLLGDDSHTHRRVLQHYSAAFLDQVSGVLLAVTVVAYIMYTLSSKTAAEVGSEVLSYSTVFVLYGVFRYLYLVHKGNGGNPTETLLTDRALLIDVLLWILYCGWVIYRPI